MHLLSGLAAHGRVVPAALAIAGLAVGAGGTAAILSSSGPSHAVSMPAAGRGSAMLEVASGTPVLTITVARLGGTLLRVSTPNSAPVRPVLAGSAPVMLSLVGASADDHGHPAADVVSVVLNAAVVWSLDLAAGTERTSADLRGGRVGGITVTAGSDILDVSLPRPTRTTALRLAGGASQFLVSLPGGTVLTPSGWSTATSRFDIDAVAGVSRLTVSRW